METVVNKINSCVRELEITAKEEEVKPIYDQTLEKYVKNINFPGFRKGKAPISMILKRFSKDIDLDFKEEVINEFTKRAAVEQNINPISRAEVIQEEYKKGESYYFKVKFEVLPEYELKQYKDLEVEKTTFKIQDQDIDAEIQKILESQKELVDDTKAIDENYIVTVDFQALDASGLPLLNQKSADLPIQLTEQTLDKRIKEKLTNCSVGDEISITLDPIDEKQEQFNALFNVKKIQKIIFPVLNEELVKKVTKDRLTSVEDLRKEIKESYEKQDNIMSENILRTNLENELIKANEFDAPNVMVENYLDEMVETYKNQQPNKNLPHNFNPEEYKNQNRVYAVQKIKTYFLRSRIAEAEGLKIDDVDLNVHAEAESVRTGISQDRLINYYKSSEDIKDKLLQKKIDDFLFANNKVIEKEFNPNKEENKIVTE